MGFQSGAKLNHTDSSTENDQVCSFLSKLEQDQRHYVL